MIWKDKVALITGGGSGIGKALSLAMAKRGVRVVVTDVNAETAARVAEQCGPGATSRGLDVRDAQAVKEAVDAAAAPTGRLDFLFNNAGIGIGGNAHELTLAHWERILDINVRGVLHGITAAYPRMVQQGSGHIINTASMAGLGPAPLLAPYAMTKHAVVGLSTSLRMEAAALGVRVSVLCPSAIETPILDSDNPSDLPAVTWRPNIRRFLTRLAGPPYPVDRLAAEALEAIEANEGVIVIPARARMLWRLGRLVPALVEKGSIAAVAAERASKS